MSTASGGHLCLSPRVEIDDFGPLAHDPGCSGHGMPHVLWYTGALLFRRLLYISHGCCGCCIVGRQATLQWQAGCCMLVLAKQSL